MQYIIFLVVTSTTYYGVVLFMFYKNDIFFYINKSQVSLLRREIKINGETIAASSFENAIDPGILQHEIQLLIKEAADKKLIKEEVIMSLQILLASNHSLQSSSLKESINNYIITQTETICSIHLKEEDVNAVWLR